MLGEFGDDPERYDSVKSCRNYAGTSPLTVASGRKRTVRARFVRNRRLYDAADLHHQALRALANRLVGYLHGCLKRRLPYDETTAWGHRSIHEDLAA